MKTATLFATAVLCLACYSCTSQGKSHTPAAAANGYAVVELFTSEGCSSCPSAEAVLARINNEHNEHVYVLEFHVDYWNYLGWKDAFSDPSFTERQQTYASVFHLNSAYTPQAIVNGSNELVGSDEGRLRNDINASLAQKAGCAIQLSARTANGNIEVRYALAGTGNDVLNIALIQKHAETDVRRGENSGRKLQHINTVRSFTILDDGKSSGVIQIPLPAGLSYNEAAIIAYTQQRDSWKITGAAKADIDF